MKITKRQLSNLIQRNLLEATETEIGHLKEALNIPKKFLPFQDMFGDNYRRTIPLYFGTDESNKFGGLSGVLLLTRHPVDVYRMSDFELIESCHSPPFKKSGGYEYDNLNSCILSEAYAFGIVAYFYEIGDKDEIDETMSDISSNDDREIFSDPDRGIVTGLPDPNARVRIKNVTYFEKQKNKPYRKFTKFDPVKHKDEYKFEGEESEAPVTFLPVLETSSKGMYGVYSNRENIINYIQSILKPYQTQAMQQIDAIAKKNQHDFVDRSNFYKFGGTYQDSPVDEEIEEIVKEYNKDNDTHLKTIGKVNLTSAFQDDVIGLATKSYPPNAELQLNKLSEYIETLPLKDNDGNISRKNIVNIKIDDHRSRPEEKKYFIEMYHKDLFMQFNYKSNKIIVDYDNQMLRKDSSNVYSLNSSIASELNNDIYRNDNFKSDILSLIPNYFNHAYTNNVVHSLQLVNNINPLDSNSLNSQIEDFDITITISLANLVNSSSNGAVNNWTVFAKRFIESINKIKSFIKEKLMLSLITNNIVKVNEDQYREDFEAKQRKEKENFDTQQAWKVSNIPNYKNSVVFKGKEYNDAELREKIKNLDIYKKYSFVYKELIDIVNKYFTGDGKLKNHAHLGIGGMEHFDCQIQILSDKNPVVFDNMIKYKHLKQMKVIFKINIDEKLLQSNDTNLNINKNLCDYPQFSTEFCKYCTYTSTVNDYLKQTDNEIIFDLETFLNEKIDDVILEKTKYNGYDYDFMRVYRIDKLIQSIFGFMKTRYTELLSLDNTSPQNESVFSRYNKNQLLESRYYTSILHQVISTLVYNRLREK